MSVIFSIAGGFSSQLGKDYLSCTVGSLSRGPDFYQDVKTVSVKYMRGRGVVETAKFLDCGILMFLEFLEKIPGLIFGKL